MFEILRAYPRIVVTGPQRSGTTICSRMIAHDTGHRLCDEQDWGVHDPAALLHELRQEPVVAHCPTLFKWIVDRPSPDVLVVVVRRDLESIYASQRRIDWQFEAMELRQFGLHPVYDNGCRPRAAAVKYAYWDWGTRPPIYVEVNYDDLRTHTLWVDPGDRERFAPKQTAPEPAPEPAPD